MGSAISFGPKTKYKKIIKTASIVVAVSCALYLIVVIPLVVYYNRFSGRIYPNIYINGIYMGGKTPEEAASILTSQVKTPDKITFLAGDKTFELAAQNIGLTYDNIATADRAYRIPRTGNYIYDLSKRLNLLRNPEKIGLNPYYDKNKLDEFVQFLSEQALTKPVYPSVRLENGLIVINKGNPGEVVDASELAEAISLSLSAPNNSPITIPTKIVDPSLSDSETENTNALAQKYIGKSLTLNFEFSNFVYKDQDLIKLLNPKGGYENDMLNKILIDTTKGINREPQNPKFQFNGIRVSEFQPALDGITLDAAKLKESLVDNLDTLVGSDEKSITVQIPVIKVKPEIATSDVNDYGIKELIGRGNSNYFHSIPGRVFNVNLAASKINGTLVAPGETFSFNQTLGDVSKFTGYKEAYIISGGKTILGDGGGVCQVSTTLFRAVLNAGLPVEERNAHAYRVGYYEQNSPPGIDATVFSPGPDFRFTNDTSNHILIIAKNDPKNYSLVFELYGTADGRTAAITKPVISNYSAPLPTVYQDDPTLPVGTLKQVDFAAAGARITFNYSVTRDGQQIYQKTFVSNYRPWAAVYLKGTKI